MFVRALATRSGALLVAAVGSLVAIAVLRFVLERPAGLILLALAPIALLGIMYGVRGGLAGALFTSLVFFVWALTNGNPEAHEFVDRPLAFFALGLASGYFARGVLGDHDLQRAASRAELRSGLRGGELEVHYQPLADAQTRRVVGVGALARWRHPRRGLRNQPEFIPLAGADGRTIWELTCRVLDAALADSHRLGDGDDISVH